MSNFFFFQMVYLLTQDDWNIKYVDPIQQHNELNYPVQSSDTNVIEPKWRSLVRPRGLTMRRFLLMGFALLIALGNGSEPLDNEEGNYNWNS